MEAYIQTIMTIHEARVRQALDHRVGRRATPKEMPGAGQSIPPARLLPRRRPRPAN